MSVSLLLGRQGCCHSRCADAADAMQTKRWPAKTPTASCAVVRSDALQARSSQGAI